MSRLNTFLIWDKLEVTRRHSLILFLHNNRLLHWLKRCISEWVILSTFGLLVRVGPRLLVIIHILLNFSIDEIDVLFGLGQLVLQAHLFLFQGILSTFSVSVYQIFNLIGHVLLVHSIDHIVAISVELRWENLWHGLRGIGLVDSSRFLNELSYGLMASHCVIQRPQEMLIELLLCVAIELIILLEQGPLGTNLS